MINRFAGRNIILHFLLKKEVTIMPKRKTSQKTESGSSRSKLSKISSTEQLPKNETSKKTKKTKDPLTACSASTEKKTYPKLIDEEDNYETDVIDFSEPEPQKDAKGRLQFPEHGEFQPNLTPKEVLQLGSFGGTYFRPIKSAVTGKSYSGEWKELPTDWLTGLNIAKKVSSSTYDTNVNTYGVKCGGSLQMWEESGWIHKQDPYGWFQWYCRFYLGRRSSDDERQIGRWLRCAGTTGRWRNNLIAKCVRSGCGYDNNAISPVVRQTLQHWGYKLNKIDFDVGAKKVKNKG